MDCRGLSALSRMTPEASGGGGRRVELGEIGGRMLRSLIGRVTARPRTRGHRDIARCVLSLEPARQGADIGL